MISVIITAGGSSSRFKGQNKLLYELNGKPVISYSVELFNSLPYVDEVIICANELIIPVLSELFSNLSKVKIIKGGSNRQQSVFNGLKACNKPDYVIIHDGARPYIKADTILSCLNKAKEVGGAIVAVKTVDTIKIVDEKDIISSTPDRKFLWNAQTPQIFKYDLIYSLHEKYSGSNFTDDSLLFEVENLPVAVCEGEYSNFKITTLNDVAKINNNN